MGTFGLDVASQELWPCGSCRRHIRRAEHRCPFCDGEVATSLDAESPLHSRRLPVPHPRLSRAAQTLFLLLVASCHAETAPGGGPSGAPKPSSDSAHDASAGARTASPDEPSAPAPSTSTEPSASSAEVEAPPNRVAIYGSSCVEVSERITFARNSSRLPKDADTTLNALAELFGQYPDLVLELRGHADPTEWQRPELAAQRAKAVREALLKRGIRREAIPAVGCSGELPLEPSESPENSRVEFAIQEGWPGEDGGCSVGTPPACHTLDGTTPKAGTP
jgi:outer membrane protein OmpA-like peptidoglycan-associated protein